jgi:1-deoxy-D-xylulose-5-phosphate reductoisomerase
LRRRLTLLGATGSIGTSAADVVARAPDAFEVHAVTANANAEKLAATARRLGARRAIVVDETSFRPLRDALFGSGIVAAAGVSAMEEAAADPVDLVLSAIVGAAGLKATAAAIRSGSDIALANKECLICAGAAFMALSREYGVRVLPVDSEHNALYQLIDGRNAAEIRSYTLTASGGPFRSWTLEQMAKATPQQAVAHPTWSMGAKISVDSATLMNKGLELIEAQLLFGMPVDSVEVVIHPQSVVHSLVEYVDGSVLAQLGSPDMRTPIAQALAWPGRVASGVQFLDLLRVGRLDFEPPDLQRFPCLALAIEAARAGAEMPAVLSAANEVAVAAFLEGRLNFGGIHRVIGEVMNAWVSAGGEPELEAVLAADARARELATLHLPGGVPERSFAS